MNEDIEFSSLLASYFAVSLQLFIWSFMAENNASEKTNKNEGEMKFKEMSLEFQGSVNEFFSREAGDYERSENTRRAKRARNFRSGFDVNIIEDNKKGGRSLPLVFVSVDINARFAVRRGIA